MASDDAFTFVENDAQGRKPPQLFEDFRKLNSGVQTDIEVPLVTALRQKHPEMIVTSVPGSNVNLLQFAAAGFAQAELDDDTEPVLRWRGFIGPSHRGGSGYLADSIFFARYVHGTEKPFLKTFRPETLANFQPHVHRYKYTWSNENFILYTIVLGYGSMQFILKEPRGNETTMSHSSVVDQLLATIGAWLIKEEPAIYVYDGYWTRSTKLWEEVRKAKWSDVILDPKQKKALTEVASKFFDSKDIYDEYGVPWKRGLIFHGPVVSQPRRSNTNLKHMLIIPPL